MSILRACKDIEGHLRHHLLRAGRLLRAIPTFFSYLMLAIGLLVVVGLVAGRVCTLVVAQVMWSGKVDTWRGITEK